MLVLQVVGSIADMLVVYRLFVNWRFMRGIEAQFLALQKGFNELIPQHLLRPFDEKELEVSVCGSHYSYVVLQSLKPSFSR